MSLLELETDEIFLFLWIKYTEYEDMLQMNIK